MQMLVRAIRVSIESLTREQENSAIKIAQPSAAGRRRAGDQARRNMEIFERAFADVAPFAAGARASRGADKTPRPPGAGGEEIDDLSARWKRCSSASPAERQGQAEHTIGICTGPA